MASYALHRSLCMSSVRISKVWLVSLMWLDSCVLCSLYSSYHTIQYFPALPTFILSSPLWPNHFLSLWASQLMSCALLSFCVSDSYLCHFPPTPLHLILVNYTSSSKSPPASPLLLPLSRLLVLSCFIPLLDSIRLHSFTGAWQVSINKLSWHNLYFLNWQHRIWMLH